MGDFGYAILTLAKSLIFTVPAVLSLALGIGANTAVYNLVEGVLLNLPLAGREFIERDAGTPKVAIVNQKFARH